MLLARANTDPRRPSYVFGPFVLRAVVDLVLATFTGLGPALGALIVYGLATSTGAVTFNSLLQAETPEGMRGRVFAGFDMAWQSGRLLSLLLGGLVADTLGIRAVYTSAHASCLRPQRWAGPACAAPIRHHTSG